MINPSIFREYDIRGLVETELTPDVVTQIHRAFATFMHRRNFTTAIVGRDSRSYNKAVAEQVVAALRQSGINVIDIGIVTAPAFYFSQIFLKQTAGVVVTASHNPMGWSGFKHLVGPLQTATRTELDELQAIIAEQDFVDGDGSLEEQNDIMAAYVDDMVKRVSLRKPLKVVVDCGNETASLVNPEVLRRIGCEVVEQYTTIGEPSPHEPNPSTLEALEYIAAGVKEHNADLGIGFDADGDRFGVVDKNGAVVWPDRIAMVLARSILQSHPGSAIVFDVKSTQALVDEIKNSGGSPVMWKTGHSWIRRKAQEVDAAFAAERSGHFYFRRDHYGYDDGLLVAVKLLAALDGADKPLHELLNDFPYYETSPVWHAPCADEEKYAVVDRLTKQFQTTYGEEAVIAINGARVQFADGWGLIRASSNIPALVVVWEGKTAEARDRIEQILRTALAAEVAVGKKWESG